MAYTWKRAARAIAVTSSTTCVAFFATSISDIMPISAFGIYAAIIIPVNYLLVVTMYPAALIFWDKKIDNKMCTCCDNKCDIKPPEVVDSMTDHEKYVSQLSAMERFFANKWAPFVNRFKILVVIGFILWFVFCLWQAL